MTKTRPRAHPIISSRWQPGHVIRIDTQRGSFEEVNPPLLSSAEIDVQTAFLPQLRKKPASTPATQTAYSRAWERARAAHGLKAEVNLPGRAPDAPQQPRPRNPWVPFFVIVGACLLSIIALAMFPPAA